MGAYYFIQSKLDGNVIDIAGGSTEPGASLDAWPQNPPSTGNLNQLWRFVPAPVTVSPVINSISPGTASPGSPVVIDGQGFGAQQGAGYVQLVNNGVTWGREGGQPLQPTAWVDTQIAFNVPVKNSGGIQVTPGVTANLTVTNDAGLTSNAASPSLTSAVNWPVTANSGQTQIDTTGYGFVQTTVSIDQAGNLTANTQVWDNSPWGALTGFHAATVVRLYDTFGNVVDTFTAGPFGVEGGQNNANPWSATVPANICAQLYSVAVVNFYYPQYQDPQAILNWVVNNASPIASAATAVVSAF